MGRKVSRTCHTYYEVKAYIKEDEFYLEVDHTKAAISRGINTPRQLMRYLFTRTFKKVNAFDSKIKLYNSDLAVLLCRMRICKAMYRNVIVKF